MISPARLWALATAGLLTRLNRQDPTLLGGAAPSPAVAKELGEALRRDWGINGRLDLLDRLSSLAREGHRKDFNDACAFDVTATATLESWETLEEKVADKEKVARVLFTRRHRDRVGAKSLLAWDAGRLVTIAGWGYLTQMLSEDEAWSYVIPMAQAVQRTYASWEELGTHYLVGREFWSNTWDAELARCRLALLDDPTSPWRTLPWDTDLGAHGLTVPLQPVVMEPPPPPGQARKSGVPATVGGTTLKVPTTLRSEGKRSALPFVIVGTIVVLAGGAAGGAWYLGYFGDTGSKPSASAANGSAKPAPSAATSAKPPAPANSGAGPKGSSTAKPAASARPKH